MSYILTSIGETPESGANFTQNKLSFLSVSTKAESPAGFI